VPTNIAIFASGAGSNAENIYSFFQDSPDVNVVLICSNNKNALVLRRAEILDVEVVVFSKSQLANFNFLEKTLTSFSVDFVILAGFLLKIPRKMIDKYPNKIINVHPALLPKYGGKGMFGENVHKAVIENKEVESGITIHYVSQNYDEGEIIFNAKCEVNKNDTHESLATKIHDLEYAYFPKIIELVIKRG
jgi:phosphoribosylglycinamide formyltransferase-1